MAKGRKKKKQKTGLRFDRPTPERTARNDFRSAGAAVRVVPVIEQLRNSGVLNAQEYSALAYYRDQSGLSAKSPVKSGIDFTVGGGDGPGVSISSANLEVEKMDRQLGGFVLMVQAIAVDDQRLEEWCIGHGSKVSKGEVHEAFPKDDWDRVNRRLRSGLDVAHPRDVVFAIMELKFAAGNLTPQNAWAA